MDIEKTAKQFIYQRLKELILKSKMSGANTLARAIKVLFPEEGELAICDCIFSASSDYCRGKSRGKLIKEFNRLINECYRFDILFSPRGAELYRLGKWSYEKNPHKAKQYLSLYLCAQEECCGETYKARWQRQAKKLLEELHKKRRAK